MAATGTISFFIYTSEAYIPIEGATVIVRSSNPPKDIVGIRVTDSSGKTEPFTIETPDSSLSESPENTIQPWSGLDAVIEHPDYERVILNNIQVFPGIETLQSVQLLPLQEFDTGYDQSQEYFFTPQPLWEGQFND